MGERAIENRIKKLKELEEQRKQIEEQEEKIKAEIKADMQQKGMDEMNIGDFVVRFKEIVTNRFNSKLFQKEHKDLYEKYINQTVSTRFTIV